MKKFNLPAFYRSSFTGQIKNVRKSNDPRKKDFSPTLLDFGPVRFYMARHFGFCYGVENAIEISYKAIEENPDKRIFLLSQMIHNQVVNADLNNRGVRFIMDTYGRQLIPWEEITPADVVIIPAFGTTVEIRQLLEEKGVEIQRYNTTCPFVEKVWKRSHQLGASGYTVVIHGKAKHEETRATFSHSYQNAPSVVVKNMQETVVLAEFIRGERSPDEFYDRFKGRYSNGFDPATDLQRIGVVNQTTMLASDTQAIADYLKSTIVSKYGAAHYKDHFADTRDTLCYATNDNQQATYGLLEQDDADLALVIGGYNSSNTAHLAELCMRKFPTYFINSPAEIVSGETIHHFNFQDRKMEQTTGFLPEKEVTTIILTSGASCPDSLVDAVLDRLLEFYSGTLSKEEVSAAIRNMQ